MELSGVPGERDERRMFERFDTQLPTKFKDSDAEYGTDVFLRDFSASGARMHTRERFFIDDMLSVQIEIPDGHDPLPLNGRVRWIKPRTTSMYELGIEFHKVHLMKMHRLVKFANEVNEVEETAA